jgi:hypothetical protein
MLAGLLVYTHFSSQYGNYKRAISGVKGVGLASWTSPNRIGLSVQRVLFPSVTCSLWKAVNDLCDGRLGFMPSVCRQFRRQLAWSALPHMPNLDAQYFLPSVLCSARARAAARGSTEPIAKSPGFGPEFVTSKNCSFAGLSTVFGLPDARLRKLEVHESVLQFALRCRPLLAVGVFSSTVIHSPVSLTVPEECLED